MKAILLAATIVSAVAILSIAAFLVLSAAPLIVSGEIFSLLSGTWRPTGQPPAYGIGPMIAGSLALAGLALALAFPGAIGICALGQGLAPRPLAGAALLAIRFLAGVPTVVYGFISAILLVPFVRSLGGGTGFSLFTAAVVLALLILPTLVLIIQAWLDRAGPGLRLTCAALGMSPARAFLSALLPSARPALLAAAALGFCRAVGDTLVALMVAGNAPQLPSSLFDSIRTLTAHIGLVLATDPYSPEYRSVAAAGLLLLAVNGALALAIRGIAAPLPTAVRHA